MDSNQKYRLKQANKKLDELQELFYELGQERAQVDSCKADHDYSWLASLEESMGHAMVMVESLLKREEYRKTVRYIYGEMSGNE